MTRKKRGNARRGVLLLIILGLLAMFGLVAIAFVVITGQARRGARTLQRVDQAADPPEALLHQGAMQAFTGSNNRASVIGPHGLLEDIYGNDSVRGNVLNAPPPQPGQPELVCGGQLIEFTPSMPGDPRRRAGCVLTMLEGPAAGLSTRIVDYRFIDNRFQIAAFDGVPSAAVRDFNYAFNMGPDYVINGTPFSGSGVGYNAGGLLDAGAPGRPLALLPNPTDPAFRAHILGGVKLNEDYDAVDYQNMLLAMILPNGQVPIPSLHRPALIRYWINQAGANWAGDPALRRRVILRPLPQDHPNFTGSNPLFDPIGFDTNGDGIPDQFSWDVDNNGDTIPDSIWVDLGMPVRSTADGRLYKPLFAILCVDLDGRLNLNAHGAPTQLDPAYYGPVAPGGPKLPRGQGYGPAEVNLLPLFLDVADPRLLYRNLLLGVNNGSGSLDGRYGEADLWDPMNIYLPAPGYSRPPQIEDDPLSQNKHFAYPDYWPALTADPAVPVPTEYGTPADMKGSLALGVDARGLPSYNYIGGTPQDAQINDLYEIDLSQNRAYGAGTSSSSFIPDNPYSVSELEPLLRPFDRDTQSLPSRLAWLTGPALMHRRHEITTASFDLPCPPVALTQDLPKLPGQRPDHILDLYLAGGASLATTPGSDMIPREFLRGLRMNLNRPLGNGRDDNNNGVVDDPAEALAGEVLNLVDQLGNPLAGGVPFDHDNDGSAAVAEDPRQRLARHLYILMMLLADNGCYPPWADSGATGFNPQRERARWIAQWAVNVVDFRDSDSIMTRFRYDWQPFGRGGWDPTEEVWGCERPELLISETLAFHDRRTEDRSDEKWVKDLDVSWTETDDWQAGTTEDSEDDKKKDGDFDQRLKPQGSLFIELYNPWGNSRVNDPNEPVQEPRPGEFYFNRSNSQWMEGVDLTAIAGGSCVWRMIVVVENDDNPAEGEDDRERDPDDPDSTKRPDPDSIERAVYFAEASFPDDGTVKHYPGGSYASAIDVIRPGQYAVIGPGEGDGPGPAETHIGLRRNQSDPNKPIEGNNDRQIILDPGAGHPVDVLHNGASGGLPGAIDVPLPPVAVVINQPHRLSVSEPVGDAAAGDYYYDSDGADGAAYDPVNGYPKPYDRPRDAKKQPERWEKYLKHTKTHDNFCVVHLQRLANPLLPYDEVTNPYRTIDSMPVDLTTFNGVDTSGHDEPGSTGDSIDVNFSTRERGEWQKEEGQTLSPPRNPFNLWRHEPTSPKSAWRPPRPYDQTDDMQYTFKHHFQHSWGHLNQQFGQRKNGGGFAGGYPQEGVFPWFCWNNRPFVSPVELMLVPSLRSSKLLEFYNVATDPVSLDPYNRAVEPFPQLLNFFHSEQDANGAPPAKFYRLLEFVHVPSPFVGTEVQGNPTAFTGNMGGVHGFHPPFNRISRYRDPGRINLNTIFSPRVWQGLMNNFPGLGMPAFWKNGFIVSRRGYGVPDPTRDQVAEMLLFDPQYPTVFAKPFRSFGGGQQVPLAALQPQREIDATLLRSGANLTDPTSKRPLLAFDQKITDPLDPMTGQYGPFNDHDRNPFFRYQALQRLGNLVTTRSNVYAVWITVGYFEVTLGTVDPVHPDGYMLGAELGTDTGEIERHRAFYIFDRSIPVGFERGKDLNVEQAILLKRFIE